MGPDFSHWLIRTNKPMRKHARNYHNVFVRIIFTNSLCGIESEYKADGPTSTLSTMSAPDRTPRCLDVDLKDNFIASDKSPTEALL